MRRWFLIFGFLLTWSEFASGQPTVQFFIHTANLEFKEAKQAASQEKDSLLRYEMLQLADILFYEGQIDKNNFNQSSGKANDRIELVVLRTLREGYIHLFYDQVKGEAYKKFYSAYMLAKSSSYDFLTKASLMALLKYHTFEIPQYSDYHLGYLSHFTSLQDNSVDRFWAAIYKVIFYSKSIQQGDKEYERLSYTLNEFENSIQSNSPLLTYLFYEKALQLDTQKKEDLAVSYYLKVIEQAKDLPFLRYHRFFSNLKLMTIKMGQKKFDSAQLHLDRARIEIEKYDTLRSNYYLNLYSSFLMKEQKKHDVAFDLLWEAYRQDYQLDFRRNTLEINRLNVELETQEKENANLRLRQNRTWLITALAGVALLLLMSYLAYANQRSKNKIQLREKEMQALELEKMLKDQEVFGIDAMIEGQEKERQRIANDLHDNLGSSLATLKLHLQNIRGNIDAKDVDQDKLLQKTDNLLEETYQKVRGIAHAGNAGVNAQEGLVPAVKSFASKVSIINRLVIDVEEHGMNSRLENSLEITIFRIIQELITNVIKHANANHVVIHLTQHDDSINLMVEDNGIGLDLSKIKPSMGMGLYSIQKKIENIGGRVTIESVAQKGTTVIIDVPIT